MKELNAPAFPLVNPLAPTGLTKVEYLSAHLLTGFIIADTEGVRSHGELAYLACEYARELICAISKLKEEEEYESN